MAFLTSTSLTLMIQGEDQIHDTEKITCLESLNTKRETSACPRNNVEYNVRAKAMACDKVQQDCTSPQKFKYHCVLNVWGNATVEVCAEEKIIVGRKCTEYSHGGAFLQEHYENSCTSCPYLYNSSDVYLYQECFQFQSLSVASRGLKNDTDIKNTDGNSQTFRKDICKICLFYQVI
ncbi:uncharacterized protein LOC134241602 [Saccostrea cucullata]|uniref:uncharacterized protein LOC134241602 n=1 Tax=Saccostrea cuccullata TaxID=36930 RepID=UPI002ED3A06C